MQEEGSSFYTHYRLHYTRQGHSPPHDSSSSLYTSMTDSFLLYSSGFWPEPKPEFKTDKHNNIIIIVDWYPHWWTRTGRDKITPPHLPTSSPHCLFCPARSMPLIFSVPQNTRTSWMDSRAAAESARPQPVARSTWRCIIGSQLILLITNVARSIELTEREKADERRKIVCGRVGVQEMAMKMGRLWRYQNRIRGAKGAAVVVVNTRRSVEHYYYYYYYC